jgi:hypothetical protein
VVNYKVIYKFGGYLPPLTKANFKDSSTIPVKFQLFDANGNIVSTATGQLFVDGSPATSSGSSNSGSNLRYDPTS